jgi:hypothetical protein
MGFQSHALSGTWYYTCMAAPLVCIVFYVSICLTEAYTEHVVYCFTFRSQTEQDDTYKAEESKTSLQIKTALSRFCGTVPNRVEVYLAYDTPLSPLYQSVLDPSSLPTTEAWKFSLRQCRPPPVGTVRVTWVAGRPRKVPIDRVGVGVVITVRTACR